jgi:hypothetical protein
MRIKKLIVGVTVLAAPAFAMAQSAEQLIAKYAALAQNCEANAKSLVNGLRAGSGTTVKLHVVCPSTTTTSTSGPFLLKPGLAVPPIPLPPVEFNPPTEKMGFGNVDNALTLAQGSLANLKIVGVSAANLRAVLLGGEAYPLTTPSGARIVVPGILTLRAQGLGWGEIARHPQVDAKL